MNRILIKIFLIIVPIPLLALVLITHLNYRKEEQPLRYSYSSKISPSEIRFRGKSVKITEIDDPNKVQEVMDSNPANAVFPKGGKIITGHKEGGFGDLVLLKNGDLVEIYDSIGVLKSYLVYDVIDIRVDNLGTGGIVREKSDSKKLSNWKNNPKVRLLQTCLEVGENDYLVRIVAIKEKEL